MLTRGGPDFQDQGGAAVLSLAWDRGGYLEGVARGCLYPNSRSLPVAKCVILQCAGRLLRCASVSTWEKQSSPSSFSIRLQY